MKKVLSLLIAICLVVSMIPCTVRAEGNESYPVLEMDVETTITTAGEDYAYVTFTPAVSGYYRFYSEGEYDTVGILYDSEMSQWGYNDDCRKDEHTHSNKQNFCLNTRLNAGSVYTLGVKLYNNSVADVTIGVTCGHDYEGVYDEASDTIVFTCSMCGDSYSKDCTAMEGGSMTFSCTYTEVNYITFVPETTDNYRFTFESEYFVTAELCNAQMEYVAGVPHLCFDRSHGHRDSDNYCIDAELQAGHTYILCATMDRGDSADVTVSNTCPHYYDADSFDTADGSCAITYACNRCGDSYSEDCPTLSFGSEITIGANWTSSTYVAFTPEISGRYCVYSLSERDTILEDFYDTDRNWVELEYDCMDDSHAHPNSDNFCVTGDLVGGKTYIVGVQVYGTSMDKEVTLGVSCGHAFVSEVTQEATCAEPGILTHTCTVCGYVLTEEITVDHTYVGEVTKEGDCADYGIRTYTCIVCGDSYTEEIWIPHTYLSEINQEATCSEPGSITHTCVVCGNVQTETYRVSHSYECVDFQEATCFEEGYETYTCTVCGDTYTETSWGWHRYEREIIKEGSCTEVSIERYTCKLCGISYTEEGWYSHSYEDVIYAEPTCTEEGSQGECCTICGDSYGPWSIDPLGHDYSNGTSCSNCGQALAAEGSWEHLHYTLVDGVLTLTGVGEMPEPIIIDAYYTEYINNTPWEGAPIREVVIGEGITNVNPALFRDHKELEKVTLPATVTVIGAEAFYGCSALTAIDLPDALRTLGSSALAYTGLQEIHIPMYVTELYDVLYGCRDLAYISVDENNTAYRSDEQGVLYNRAMTELLLMPCAYEGTYVLPATVTEINTVFHDSPALDTIRVAEGNSVYYSRNGMLYCYRVYASTWLDGSRFYDCTDDVLVACPPAMELGSFTIDGETGGLENYAFANCTSLTNLTIPVTCRINVHFYVNGSFGNHVEGCTALEGVWFEEGHPECFSDDEGAVYNVTARSISLVGGNYGYGTVLEFLPATRTDSYLEIPEGIEAITANLSNPNLKAIRFPSTLTALDSYVLSDSNVEWILFTGEKPLVSYMGDPWATDLTANIYYPAWLSSWTEDGIELDEYPADVTYIPYEQGKAPVWGGEGNPFTDVPHDSFYCESVLWAVENGITNGLDADSFGPEATCNRAQVVTFLWRAMGCPEPKSTTHSFVDVEKGSFYEKPVLWAVENGITNGSDATHFGPTLDCNRAQVVTFMYRTFGSPEVTLEGLPFVDVPAGSWYEAPIAWAVANGVTNGLDSTHFGPTGICNRAQVVTFLYRAFAE